MFVISSAWCGFCLCKFIDRMQLFTFTVAENDVSTMQIRPSKRKYSGNWLTRILVTVDGLFSACLFFAIQDTLRLCVYCYCQFEKRTPFDRFSLNLIWFSKFHCQTQWKLAKEAENFYENTHCLTMLWIFNKRTTSIRNDGIRSTECISQLWGTP